MCVQKCSLPSSQTREKIHHATVDLDEQFNSLNDSIVTRCAGARQGSEGGTVVSLFWVGSDGGRQTEGVDTNKWRCGDV